MPLARAAPGRDVVAAAKVTATPAGSEAQQLALTDHYSGSDPYWVGDRGPPPCHGFARQTRSPYM